MIYNRPITATEIIRGSDRIRGRYEGDSRTNEEIIAEIHRENQETLRRNTIN